MRILIAEDDTISRCLLQATLSQWGYEVVATQDGLEAYRALREPEGPRLAILDWMMPGLDGLDVCRKIRAEMMTEPPYLLLLTSRANKGDIADGLNSGADDYLTKPFDREELHARLRVGFRILEMQKNLADRVGQLEEALARVRQLQGLVPVCAYCKKIRNDQNYWQQVDAYLSAHTDARVSHGICPECLESVVKPQLDSLNRNDAGRRLSAKHTSR
jgi:phosphoserine phosphatase RsbU/P